MAHPPVGVRDGFAVRVFSAPDVDVESELIYRKWVTRVRLILQSGHGGRCLRVFLPPIFFMSRAKVKRWVSAIFIVQQGVQPMSGILPWCNWAHRRIEHSQF
jgi:hypothetical protein